MDRILASFADFACELKYGTLPAGAITASRDILLDSLGCAVGAYDCDAARIGRSLSIPVNRKELGGRIVGSRDSVAAEGAAFVNSSMIRNLELNDAFPGGHPSDCIGGFFALAPQLEVSGERLLTATIVAYEIILRLQISTSLTDRGWDQGFNIGVGSAAGLAHLMGLNREATQHAIAITAVTNMQLGATRTGQLSMWKDVASAYAVRNAVFGVQLAAGGMTGPEAPFTGRRGLIEVVTGALEIPPFGNGANDFYIQKVNSKYWPVSYSLQAIVWAGLELRKQVAVQDLVSIEALVSKHSWEQKASELGKWDPQTRATADHSLPYILIRSMLHGTIDEESFQPAAYGDPAIRPLMKLVTARVDDEIDKDAQRDVFRVRVNAKDKAGKSYEVEIVNPLGHKNNPLTAKEFADKFLRLSAPKLGQRAAEAGLKQWQNIETLKNVKSAFDAIQVLPDGERR